MENHGRTSVSNPDPVSLTAIEDHAAPVVSIDAIGNHASPVVSAAPVVSIDAIGNHASPVVSIDPSVTASEVAAPTSENSDAHSSPSILIATPSTSISQADIDYALARAVHEQERAFRLLQQRNSGYGGGYYGSDSSGYGGGYYGSDSGYGGGYDGGYSGYSNEISNYENYDYGGDQTSYDYEDTEAAHDSNYDQVEHDNNLGNYDQVEHDNNNLGNYDQVEHDNNLGNYDQELGEHDANSHVTMEFQAIENLAAEFSSHVGLDGDREEQNPDQSEWGERENEVTNDQQALGDSGWNDWEYDQQTQGESGWNDYEYEESGLNNLGYETANNQQAWGESGWNNWGYETGNNPQAQGEIQQAESGWNYEEAERAWNNRYTHELSTNYYGNQGIDQDASEQPERTTGDQVDHVHALEEGNTGWGAENHESDHRVWEDENGQNNTNQGYGGWDEGGWDNENHITYWRNQDEEENRRWGTRDYGADDPEYSYEVYGADDPEYSYEVLIALAELVGTVSKGLPAEAIASLPSVVYKAKNAQEDSEKCVICQMDYEDDEALTVLHCKHTYHSECIKQWLQTNKVCPICNCEVSES